MKNWKFIIGIFLLTVLSACLLNKNIESFTDPKGDLYLLLEAPGFNVPELNQTQQLMDPNLAQSKFNNVVVVANSAKYKALTLFFSGQQSRVHFLLIGRPLAHSRCQLRR